MMDHRHLSPHPEIGLRQLKSRMEEVKKRTDRLTYHQTEKSWGWLNGKIKLGATVLLIVTLATAIAH